MGASYELPLPLLIGHDYCRAIGWVTDAKQTAKHLMFKAKIANSGLPEADEAWLEIKGGSRGVSAGFPGDVKMQCMWSRRGCLSRNILGFGIGASCPGALAAAQTRTP